MKLAIISPYPPIKGGISKETELLYFILKDSYDLNIYTFTKLYPSFLYPSKTQKDKSVFEINDKNYIGVSGGVEPIFALYYTRRTESFKNNEFYKVFHSTVQAYIDKMNLHEEIESAEKVEDALPSYFQRTAHHINPDNRVVIQGHIQKYIDHSISSTINLSEDVQPEVISNIYLMAWKKGLKGVTIYREGSRFPILSTEGELTEFQRVKEKEFRITIDRDQVITANGEEIIKLQDGSLTTVYHHLKNSGIAIEEVLTSTKFEGIEA